jgi:hypothetical protein
MQYIFSVSSFAHRNNRDGSIDSICPRCFATIGTSTWESDLNRIEYSHRCDPELLRRWEDAPKKEESPKQQQMVAAQPFCF